MSKTPGNGEPTALTVRELAIRLLAFDNLDADCAMSFHGSAPIPIVEIYDNGEDQIIFTDQVESSERDSDD